MTDQRPQLPELRPLALAELFDGAIGLTVRGFRFVAPLAAAVMAPFQLVAALLNRSIRVETAVVDSQGDASLFAGTRSDVARRIGALAIVQLGALVVVSVVVVVAVDALLARSASRRDTLRYGLRRLPSLVPFAVLSFALVASPVAIGAWVAGLAGRDDLGVAGIIGALMVVGMVLWVAVSMVPGASGLLVERTGPLKAVGRAFLLSRGQWRRCLAVFVVGTLLSQFLMAILGYTVQSVLDGLGGRNDAFLFVWAAIGGTVATAAVLPFSACLGLVLYIDLRNRREAFDRAALADSRGAQR